MYIINPTPEQLKSWYKCKKTIADFLIYKCGLSLVSREGKNYYFVKNKEWEFAMQKIPFWDKVVEKF